MQFTAILGGRGRVVLPAEVREHLGVHTGDRLVISIDEDGVVRLLSMREAVSRPQGMFSYLRNGQSAVDKLIAERRREAAMEDAEDEAARRLRS